MKTRILVALLICSVALSAGAYPGSGQAPAKNRAFAKGFGIAALLSLGGVIGGAIETAEYNKDIYKTGLPCAKDGVAECCEFNSRTGVTNCRAAASSSPICPAGTSGFCVYANALYVQTSDYTYTPEAAQGLLVGKILLGLFCPLTALFLLGAGWCLI